MKIKNIKLISEEARVVDDITFNNSTEDQFPYIEATLNSIDNNFNWWKENWVTVEQLISQNLKELVKKVNDVTITSKFTFFHGHDEKDKDVVWTGACISYKINNVDNKILYLLKDKFNGVYKGKKIFVVDNQLIILFG